MRIQNIIFVVTVGVLLMPGRETFVWAQATNVVCTGCVASTDIADLGVAGADLAAGAVTGAKILDGTITAADLATSAVSSVKIADGAIVNADISAAAAIAGTKVAPNFGSQNVVTTGNAGVGTTTPSSRLDVLGALTVRGMAAPAVAPAGQGRLYYDSTANKFKVSQNGAAYVDLLGGGGSSQWTTSGTNISYATGNVGIGTTSPRAKLELMGDGASLASAKIILSETQSNLGALFLNSFRAGSGNRLDIGEGNDTFLTIRSDDDSGGTTSRGNVGIGTTSPNHLLSLNGAGPQLGLYDTQGSSRNWLMRPGHETVGSFSLVQSNVAGGNPLTAGTTRLHIDINGNVGIGTTSPINRLHIDMPNAGDLIFADTGGSAARIYNPNGFLVLQEGGGAGTTINDTTGEVIRVSGGNVGIGTTSPAAKLQIGNGSGTQGMLIQTGGTSGNYVEFDVPGRDWQVGSNLAVGGDNFEVFDQTAGFNRFLINSSGNVGIGTADPGVYKLAVKGKIHAEEVVVDTGWADFVFKKDYKLMPLEKVARHIEEAGHLPGIPSEKEVQENGVSIGQMQSKLLQKIEEMTLYVIDLKKENDQLKERISLIENQAR